MGKRYYSRRYMETNLWCVVDLRGGHKSNLGSDYAAEINRGVSIDMLRSDEVAAIFQFESWANAWCDFMNGCEGN